MLLASRQIFAALGVCTACCCVSAAPGEDTIQLQNPVEHLQLPLGTQPTSQGLDDVSDISPGLKAKIVRYEAKSFTENPTDIYTDADVNRTIRTQANRRTCIQDVGSNVGATAAMAGGRKDQIVVLRGDLVNVCR